MLSWLRLGIRRRIVQAFHPIETGGSFDFEVPYHGMRYRGNVATAQEWHVYYFGGYELREVAVILEILKRIPSAVVLDIGANLGGHTFAMASKAKHVHAFEPFGFLADRIQEQINRNRIENVSLHRFALGDLDEIKTYYLDQNSRNSGTGSFLAEHTGALAAANLQIRRGDGWADGTMVDFVKIDVEGYEAPVLRGLSKTLARSKPVIIMEVTETSWKKISEYGGLSGLIQFSFYVFEVSRPRAILGFFQHRDFILSRLEKVEPRVVSFNILIVPVDKMEIIAGI
jgi:FkbM family methyltransferase